MKCPYCKKQAEWVENKRIYGRNYGKSYMMYYCEPCDAYVGCHQNSRHALGSLANRETREKRKQAHAVFDPLWKPNKRKRGWLYSKLKKDFGHDVHIGQSDIGMCERIIRWCYDVKLI
jgi:hypothetical protein